MRAASTRASVKGRSLGLIASNERTTMSGAREQRRNGLHRQEQARGLLLQPRAVEVFMERLRSRVLGVHDRGHGPDLRSRFTATMQRVDEQEFAEPLPSVALLDGQATQQRHQELRVARQLLRQLRRGARARSRGRWLVDEKASREISVLWVRRFNSIIATADSSGRPAHASGVSSAHPAHWLNLLLASIDRHLSLVTRRVINVNH